jgi:hypothetical protein
MQLGAAKIVVKFSGTSVVKYLRTIINSSKQRLLDNKKFEQNYPITGI